MILKNSCELFEWDKVLYPRYIFRYTAADNNLYKSILESYLWFSDPMVFNDPFDCNLDIDINNNEEEVFQQIEVNAKRWKEMPEEERKSERPDIFDGKTLEEQISLIEKGAINSKNRFDKDHDEWFRIIIEKHKQIIENYGVFCFSKTHSDLLMWAHYASKHKGVVLVYDLEKLASNLIVKDAWTFIMNVKYQEPYPRFNYINYSINHETLKKSTELIKFTLATKSVHWNYEHELRIIREKKGCASDFRGKAYIDPSALVGVIFGLKCCDKNAIKKLFASKGKLPKFFSAAKDKSEFELTFAED